jgi:hypothetical protein
MSAQPAVGGTQVVEVRVEYRCPPGLIGTAQPCRRLRHQVCGPAGMPGAGGSQLVTLPEPFKPVAAQRFQEPVARSAAGAVGGDQ